MGVIVYKIIGVYRSIRVSVMVDYTRGNGRILEIHLCYIDHDVLTSLLKLPKSFPKASNLNKAGIPVSDRLFCANFRICYKIFRLRCIPSTCGIIGKALP